MEERTTEKRDTGGPAFPVSTGDAASSYQDSPFTAQFPGMTLRDYFAAKAMQGLIVNTTPDLSEGTRAHHIAEASYWLADAMLKARMR